MRPIVLYVGSSLKQIMLEGIYAGQYISPPPTSQETAS